MRRHEIQPPGIYLFGRNNGWLYNRIPRFASPYPQVPMLHYNEMVAPVPRVARHPQRKISEDVSPYPLHELEDARTELINYLYFSNNTGTNTFCRIRGLVGIIPNRYGVFPLAASMEGHVSYCEQSTSQLSNQLPLPSAPPPFNFYDTGQVSTQDVEEDDDSVQNDVNDVSSTQTVESDVHSSTQHVEINVHC
ncbi:uncharacterized protein LOC121371390 [Gigantopelta aegis]|uniref:uncharacterized protein LOC121371390 n=1 Tax=Gigantopelta aegis TaxID=1735272 RepID=UPI001B88E046|nr:uncharacterized protein LOC121371390 [Gigantopelta aegis]